MASRCKAKNPLPVIFSIKGGSRINHEIATSLRTSLQNSTIEFLIDDVEAKESLKDKKYYENSDVHGRIFYEMPYKQTTAMQNELINLDHEIVGGFVKIKEKSTKRKDRYSSLAYCNYLAKTLEKDLVESNEYDEDDDIVYFIQ